MSNVVDVIFEKSASLSSYGQHLPSLTSSRVRANLRPRPLGTSPILSVLPNPAIDTRTYASMYAFFSSFDPSPSHQP